MDLRHIKYFLAVADELHMGRAARRLGISQPPLTRQIRQIEEELQVQLFLRTPRGMELTQAGEVFRVEAANISMMVSAGIDRVQRVGQGRLGRIDIGVFGSGIYEAIPALLQKLRASLPGLNVVLHTMHREVQIEALRQRRISAGFNRMMPVLPDLAQELVTMEPLWAVLPADHPLAACESVSLEQMAAEPFVLFPNAGRPNFVDRVIRIFGDKGLDITIAQEIGDTVTGMALVAHGFGVSLVPESVTRALTLRNAVYRPLRDAPHARIDLSCIYRADDGSPQLHALLALIRVQRAARSAATLDAPAAASGPTAPAATTAAAPAPSPR